MDKVNLAVMFGSRSCEHDVSIISALQLMGAVPPEEYNIIPIYISRDGLWYTGNALKDIETFRAFNPMASGIQRPKPSKRDGMTIAKAFLIREGKSLTCPKNFTMSSK